MTTAVRGRASLAVTMRDYLKEENKALRREGKEIGAALPAAKALYRYVSVVSDDPAVEQAAARIYYLVNRAQQRHGEEAA